MNIVISDTSDTPIYQQIFEQIRAQILRGELPSGAPLPPIRTVALELRISVITVKKAWELLEGQGLITTRVGRGTVVSSMSDEELNVTKADLLQKNLAQSIQYYRELGFSREEILESIQKHFSKDDERDR
jgi:GntR family transcriptional regulator